MKIHYFIKENELLFRILLYNGRLLQEYKAPTEMDTFLPQDGSNAKDGVLSK